VKKNSIFRIDTVGTCFEIFSSEDGFELSQQFQRIINTGDNFKVLVNVSLKFGFNSRNTDIELNEISVEGVGSELKELMSFSLESTNN